MGYYRRQDLPSTTRSADAFTICDNYHCRCSGRPTLTGSCRSRAPSTPKGTAGGPVLITKRCPRPSAAALGDHARGARGRRGELEGHNPAGTLYPPPVHPEVRSWPATPSSRSSVSTRTPRRRCTRRPSSRCTPATSQPTSRRGRLPRSAGSSRGRLRRAPVVASRPRRVVHEPGAPADVEPRGVVQDGAVPHVDENDGFFDHVPPPVAPTGTAGEYVTVSPLPSDAMGMAGPYRHGLPGAHAGDLALQPGRARASRSSTTRRSCASSRSASG